MNKTVLILLLVAGFALAQGGAGSSGADFLNLGVGARPLGLAGAYTAIADDVYGMSYNPAGLSQILKAELGSYYANILADVHQGWIGYAQEAGHFLNFGFDLNLVYAEETRRNSYGDPIGIYSDFMGSFGGALAFELAEGFSLGIAGRYIFQKYDHDMGHGFAGDFGLLYHTRFNEFRVGLVAENLGPNITFRDAGDPMPMGLRLGVASSLFREDLTLTGDFAWRLENTMEANVGVEWWAVKGFAIRVGYQIFDDHDSWSGLTLGIGLDELSDVIVGSIDYAFVPQEPLGYIHRLSYTLKF